MRLTVLSNDPGERIWASRERITVYLNGVEVKYVFTADDQKGEVIAATLDCLGNLIAENGEIKRQKLLGQVRIERCPR